ncbi:MAG: hypothetical protein ACI32O_00930 [Enterococcus sp.]
MMTKNERQTRYNGVKMVLYLIFGYLESARSVFQYLIFIGLTVAGYATSAFN